MSKPEYIEVDGVRYTRQREKPSGRRAVVVIDRGWIYAGDVEDRDGRIYLTRVVWLLRWSSIGLDGVINNPASDKCTLKPHPDIDMPADAEIFRIPVPESWGL